MTETVILFRAVGEAERLLIEQSTFTAFPPRLSGQPIFYPVCNREYADQMARDWNTKDPRTGLPDGRKGYVTRFHVRQAFLDRYEVHQVGGPVHKEYWIPAEELPDFNVNIVGPIEVVAEFGGPKPP